MRTVSAVMVLTAVAMLAAQGAWGAAVLALIAGGFMVAVPDPQRR